MSQHISAMDHVLGVNDAHTAAVGGGGVHECLSGLSAEFSLYYYSLAVFFSPFASLAATVHLAQREEKACLCRTFSPVNAPANSHS